MQRLAFVLALLSAAPAAAQVRFEPLAESLRASARTRGWITQPSTRGERWCAPPGPCSDGADHVELETMGRSRLVTARLGAPDGFRATISISFWEQNEPTFSFSFTRGTESVTIQWETRAHPLPDGTYVALTGADTATVGFDAWMRAELAAYASSPTSFRDRALLRSRELRALVHTGASIVTICDDPDAPGRYRGIRSAEGASGMIDTCAHRRLTAEERAAYLARVGAALDERDRLVEAHFAAWQPIVAAIVAPRP